MTGQSEILKKIDINKNTNTDLGEIQKTLDEGFFDKKENAASLAQALENREEELKFLSEIGILLIDILEARKNTVATAQPKIAGQLQLAINTIQKNQSINSMLNAFSTAITYANTYESSRSSMMKGAVTGENIPGKKDLDDFITSLKKTLGGEYVLSPTLKGEIYSKIRAYGGSATSAHILEFLKKDILQDKDLLSARGLAALLKKIAEIQKPARDLKNMERLNAKKMLASLFGDIIDNEEVKEELEECLQDAVDDFKEQKEGITSVEGTKDIAKNTVIQILKDYHGVKTNPDRWYENTAEKVAENIAKNDPDPFAVKGLEDLWKDLHTPASGVKIDIYQIIKQSQDAALQLTAESILSDKLIEGSLEAYSPSLDALRTKNTTVNLYADILGTGGWDLADTSIESMKFRGKEMAIQIASIALSGGIAGFATRGVMLGGALGLKSAASSVRILKFANNIKKYYLISKYAKSGVALANTMSLGTRLGIGALDLAVEGSLFHVANTMISGAINDIPWDKTLGELSHLKGYLQSVAYFGVLKAFSKVGGGLLTKPIKSLGEKITNPAILSMLSKGIQISLETASMTGTDTVINIAFGEGLKAPSREDVIHTFTIVVGLKLAHGLTGDLSKIKNFEAVRGKDGKIFVTWEEGKVASQSIEKSGKLASKKTLASRDMTRNRDLGHLKGIPHFEEACENLKPGSSILELGTGEGIALNELIQKSSGIKAFGLDLDVSRISKDSKATIKEHNLENGLASGLEKLGLAEKSSLDFIYSFYALQYTKNGPDLLNQAYQALKPGGKAVLHLGFNGTMKKDFENVFFKDNKLAKQKGAIQRFSIPDSKGRGLSMEYYVLTKVPEIQEIKIPAYIPSKGEYWKDSSGNNKSNSDLRYRYEFDIEKSFKTDYEQGKVTRKEVIGHRNLGIYEYYGKIIKVVKDKRTVSIEQIQAMNEKLADLDNVFHPVYSFPLKEGASCLVMNIAPGKDAGTLTPEEIAAIPQAHWEKFEATIRELSKRGVQTDLTKRSNFLYDQEKGFQFLDINGISMDGKGTDKFFMQDGKAYYYAFEQYRFLPKEYVSAKEMFLGIRNEVIVVAEGSAGKEISDSKVIEEEIVNKYRDANEENLRRNIRILQEDTNITDKDDLIKMLYVLRYVRSTDLKENIQVLQKYAGITDKNDFITMVKVLQYTRSDILKEQIQILQRDAQITDKDGLIQAREILENSTENNSLENLKIIINDAKITDKDGLIKITHALINARTENLRIIINDAKITNANDLISMKDALEFSNRENLKKNLKILQEDAGIMDKDDLIKMRYFLDNAKPERLKQNIQIVKQDAKISDVKSLIKLQDVLRKANPENLKIIINDAKITNIQDLINLGLLYEGGLFSLLEKAEPENLKVVINDAKITNPDALIHLRNVLEKAEPKNLKIFIERGINTVKRISDWHDFAPTAFVKTMGGKEMILIEHAVKSDNPYYLEQNIQILKTLVLPKGKHQELQEILDATGGFLLSSLVKGYIIENQNLGMLINDMKKLQADVLSGEKIDMEHYDKNLLAETIYMAYRPSGYTMASLQEKLAELQDHTDHLSQLIYNKEGYHYNLGHASYQMKPGESVNYERLLGSLSHLTNMPKVLVNYKTICQNILNPAADVQKQQESITLLFGLNADERIGVLRKKLSTNPKIDYTMLSTLQEVYTVVVKDSFGPVFQNMFKATELLSTSQSSIKKLTPQFLTQLTNREKQKLSPGEAEHIKILKNILTQTTAPTSEQCTLILVRRLSQLCKPYRDIIKKEKERFVLQEDPGQGTTKVTYRLSKNVGSFFAKAGAELCTSDNIDMRNEERHLHINIIDEARQQIIGNIMLYKEPGRDYLIVRGFNPRRDFLATVDARKLSDTMMQTVMQIAQQNNYKRIYIPPQTLWHGLTNRDHFSHYFTKTSDTYKSDPDYHIKNANFYATELETGVKFDDLYLLRKGE